MATALPPVHPGVELWLIDLDAPDAVGDGALLSNDEAARASRFVFDLHRRRFTAGRAALRRILASEVGCAPEAVSFDYNPAGKPALSGAADGAVRFNLSHSEQWGLLAVSRAGEIGVDIEKQRPMADVLRLAQTAFSPAERAELGRVPPAGQLDAFFAGWTRKEAYIKARGDRLALLQDFDVSLALDRPRLVRAAAPAEVERWTLVSFVPVLGYAAALCLERATSSAGRT